MKDGTGKIEIACCVAFSATTPVLSPITKDAVQIFVDIKRRFTQELGNDVEIGDYGFGGGGFDFFYFVAFERAKDAESTLRRILNEYGDSLQIHIEQVERDYDNDESATLH